MTTTTTESHSITTNVRRRDTALGAHRGNVYRIDVECSCGWRQSFHDENATHQAAHAASSEHSRKIEHAETYRGREIRVERVPASRYENDGTASSWQGEHLQPSIDGREYRNTTQNLKSVIRQARNYIDTDLADAEILPLLQRVIANADSVDALRSPRSFDEVPVDGEAWVYAMGRRRRGIVTAHGKTNVAVAYTTASNPTRVFRKSVPLHTAWIAV